MHYSDMHYSAIRFPRQSRQDNEELRGINGIRDTSCLGEYGADDDGRLMTDEKSEELGVGLTVDLVWPREGMS